MSTSSSETHVSGSRTAIGIRVARRSQNSTAMESATIGASQMIAPAYPRIASLVYSDNAIAIQYRAQAYPSSPNQKPMRAAERAEPSPSAARAMETASGVRQTNAGTRNGNGGNDTANSSAATPATTASARVGRSVRPFTAVLLCLRQPSGRSPRAACARVPDRWAHGTRFLRG